MKNIYIFLTFLFLVLFTSSNTFSQSPANYTFATNTTGSLTDMTSGATQIVAGAQDDVSSALTNISFEFWFMGTRYTQFAASSNGFVRLGATVTTTRYTLAAATEALISAYGSDEMTNALGAGGVFYKVTGSAPNRVLTIHFAGQTIIYDAAGATADGTFQVRLYETTNTIEFVYGLMNRNSSTGFNASMDPQWIGFSSTTTLYATVDMTTDVVTTSGGVTSNQPALSSVLPLNSPTDGSRKTYSFTPTGTTAPSGLNFTAITGGGMTLNWTDNSSDESGFAVYRSDDGGTTYNYVTKTAVNIVTYAATGLTANTTYNWRVYAVREAPSSTPATGSQATNPGTFTGTKTIGPGGDFTTLTAAITNMKTNFLGSPVILELLSTYTSGSETYPLDFSALGSSAVNTLTVRPQTGATGLVISGTNTTAIMTISGPYITIDGRAGGTGSSKDLTISNLSTTGSVIRFLNDGSYSTVKYCTVTGVTTSTTSGVIFFTTSTGSSGNSFNTITNNDLRNGATNPSNIIYSSGTAAAPNSDNTISSNNIFNFSGVGVNVSATANGNNWNITGNNFYNTISVATAQTGVIIASGGSGNTITNNFIGGNAPGATGTWTNTGNVTLMGVSVTAGVASINGNTIANMTGSTAGTTARTRGINYTALVAGAQMNNNTIFNLSTMSTVTGYGGSSQPAVGISGAFGGFAAAQINENLIYNITAANTFANTVSNVACGIFLTNFQGECSRNKIYDIKNKATGVTALQPPVADGIFCRFAFTAVTANNMISVGIGENTNTQFGGIQMVNANTSTNEHLYMYNSIYVGGTSGGTWSSYGYVRGDNGATTFTHDPNLYNNIIVMERTGGGSVNYAVANQGSAPASNWTSDYNFYYCSDPSTVGLWGSTAYDFAGWKTISSMDANSVSTSTLNSANLFTSTATANLLIQTANVESWLSNGNAVPNTNVNNDYQGNSRSTTVAGGATDLGADEFTPSVGPPTNSFAVGGIGAIPLTINGRTVGTVDVLNVGSSMVGLTNLDVKYFSGTNPPNSASFPVGNVYWEITPNVGAAGYSYNVTLNYSDADIGTITLEDSLRVAKSDDGGTSYIPFVVSGTGPGQYQLNAAGNTITVFGLTSFSVFALTDGTNPLPVELSSFTSVINARNVELKWTTVSELNNTGFDIERKLVSSENWSKIGNVTGNGTTNNVSNYQFEDRNLPSGKYNYRLKQIDVNGNYAYHELTSLVEVGVPVKFALSQNYPNPFNPTTKINYDLPFDSKVAIKIFDLTGREIASLVNEVKVAGYYTVNFNASSLSSGVYFYQITADGGKQNFVKTLKMMLIK